MRAIKISCFIFFILIKISGVCIGQTIRPNQISGLKLWLRADSNVTYSTTVSSWKDCSGNNYNAAQSNSAKQPAFVSAAINGHPAIRFDGSNDYLQASFGATVSQPLTCFVVYKMLNNSGASQQVFDGINTSNRISFGYNTSYGLLVYASTFINYTKALPFNNYIINSVVCNTSNSQLYENGNLKVSGNIGSGTLTGITIGIYNSLTSNPFKGDIAEIIIYTQALSATDRKNVESYLSYKYAGPPVTLGPDIHINYGMCDTVLDAGSRFSHFIWSTGDTTQTVHVSSSGMYSVTATNIFGYTSSDTINVTLPTLYLNNTLFCSGSSATLSTGLSGSYTFLWSDGSTTPTINVSAPGNYRVTVTDTLLCSKISNIATVTEDTFPAMASLGNDTNFCSGNIIELAAPKPLPAGLAYLWSTGDTTATLSVTSSGNYLITVTDINGCFAQDTIHVEVLGMAPNVSFSNSTGCSGDTIQFTNSSIPLGTSWLWNFGDGHSSAEQHPEHIFSSGGTKNVTLTVFDGTCSNSITRTMHIPAAPSAGFNAATICVGDAYSFIDHSTAAEGNIISWYWDFGDGNFSTAKDTTYSYLFPGSYDVTHIVQTDSGCHNEIKHTVDVVSSATAPLPFTIYSPSNGFTTAGHAVHFMWNNATGALSYTLQYSTDSLFSNNITNIPNLLTTSYQAGITTPDIYYWRVVAHGLCGNSATSNTYSFSVCPLSSISGLRLWLKADSAVQLSGSSVANWNDCSGNNYNALQSQSTKQPLLINSALNGKPVIRFDGVNDYLQAAFGTTLSQPLTYFIVYNMQSNTGAGQQVLDGINGSNRITLGHNTTNGLLIYSTSSISYPKSLPFNYLINSFVCNTLNSQFFENGILKASGNIGNGNITGLTIGIYNSLTQNPFKGDIAEIIIYDQALNPTNRQNVESYLSNKYAGPPVCLGPDININYGMCDTILDAGSRFSHFIWSTGDTTQTLQIKTSGIYSVTATNIFGYSSSDTINVTFPVINLHDTILCAGSSINLSSGLSGNYNYHWSNGATTPFINVANPGDYWVTVTDARLCSRISDTIAVTADYFPLLATLGNDTNICSGNYIRLIAPNPLPQGVSYTWSTGDTSPSIPVSTSGDYAVTATDQNGCVTKDTINIQIIGIAPNVSFTNTTACSGDTIYFNNTSSPAGLSWLWDFGDGNSSPDQNAKHVYHSGGIKNMTLTVTDGACTSSFSKNVYIPNSPVAAFTTSTTCVGDLYSFIDQSTSSDGNIISWLWDFGDGNHSDARDTAYSYIAAGNYNVTHTVQTDSGCHNSVTHSIHVVNTAPAPAAFTLYMPSNGYSTTEHLITFKWNPSPGALSYTLQYSADSLFNINVNSIPGLNTNICSQNMLSHGSFYWRIIAHGLCGNSTTSNVYKFSVCTPEYLSGLSLWLKADSAVVHSGSPVSSWNDCSGSNYNALQSVSAKQPQIINSVLNNKPVIRFDGVNDYLQASFGTSLYQPLTLFIVYDMQNNAGASQQVFDGINSSNRISLGYNSSNGLLVYSTSAISYSKSLPSGYLINTIVSNFSNSLFFENGFLKTSGNIGSGALTGLTVGMYNNLSQNPFKGDIAEIIIYNHALNTSERKDIESYLCNKYAGPPVNLGPDINIDYGMCDTVLDAGSRFSHFLWSTGDTTQTIPILSSGIYSVTATNIFGIQSSDTVLVKVPTINVQDTGFCYGDSIVLNINLGNDYQFLWLPDGVTGNQFTIMSGGNYSILATDTNGCQRTQAFVVSVDSFSVKATLGPDRKICQGDVISLAEGGQEATSYFWSDNTGNNYLTITDPPGSSADYSVTVTDNNGCVAVDSVNILVNGVLPSASFTNDSVCFGNINHFNDISSVAPPFSVISWNWDFGDSTYSTLQNPVHIFAHDGVFHVNITVTTDSGCVRTTGKDITVFSIPVVKFTPNTGCNGAPVSFTDQTTCSYGDLSGWSWTFGDTQHPGNDTSMQQSPHYIYDSSGVYNVKLVALSNAGCFDSAEQSINIKPSPVVDFGYSNACAGQIVYFTDLLSIPPWESITSYNWLFGDGSVSSVSNPSHLFDTAGIYNVSLSAKTLNGCVSSTTKQVVIGAIPQVTFGYANNCFNSATQFTDSSTSSQGGINYWNWSWGNMSFSNEQSPEYIFPDTGIYNIKLIVKTDLGCFDSISGPIHIYPLPVAEFSFTPEYGIPPMQVSFTNQSYGASAYLWSFGDGNTDISDNPEYTYTTQGIFSILLQAFSLQGCTDTISHKVYVLPTTVDIEATNTTLIQNGNIINVSTDLMNSGSRKIEHIDLSAQFENGNVIHEQWYGTLQQGEKIHYVFKSQFEIPSGQAINYICVTASLLPEFQEADLSDNRSCVVLSNDFVLSEPYPDPVVNHVVFTYLLPFNGKVKIELFNEIGDKIRELFNGEGQEGFNRQSFDISDINAGLYTCKITFRDKSLRKKFVKL